MLTCVRQEMTVLVLSSVKWVLRVSERLINEDDVLILAPGRSGRWHRSSSLWFFLPDENGCIVSPAPLFVTGRVTNVSSSLSEVSSPASIF